ncbi:hypothetical protein ACQPW3_40845 [Actinosynnema sp. CA-248983]
MKRIIGALAVCALLAGCGVTEWSGEARFKVDGITPDSDLVSGAKWPGFVGLDLVGEWPDGAMDFTVATAKLTDVPPDVKDGETLICSVKQRDESKFDDAEPVSTFGPCRRP